MNINPDHTLRLLKVTNVLVDQLKKRFLFEPLSPQHFPTSEALVSDNLTNIKRHSFIWVIFFGVLVNFRIRKTSQDKGKLSLTWLTQYT